VRSKADISQLNLPHGNVSTLSTALRHRHRYEFVDDTYTTIDESWLFTTSRSTVTPISVTAISCGFIVQLVSTVDKILSDIASRGPSEVAELLVFSHVKLFYSLLKKIFILCTRATHRTTAYPLHKKYHALHDAWENALTACGRR